MAPTSHCRMLTTAPDAKLGDRPVGDSRFPYDDILISWFDRFLLGKPDAWKPMPKVQVFLLGAATWLTGESWPLPETEDRTLYLTSGGLGEHAVGRRRAGGVARRGRDRLVRRRPAQPGALARRRPRDGHACLPGPAQRRVPGRRARLQHPGADRADHDRGRRQRGAVRVGRRRGHRRLRQADRRLSRRDRVQPGRQRACACGTGVAWTSRRSSCRARSSGSKSTASRPPTTSRPAISCESRWPGSNFPLADRNWHGWERNDLATDGPVAHVTLHHGAGHESAHDLPGLHR